MSNERAKEILETYKEWSCGTGRFKDYRSRFPYTKADLNEAISLAIKAL